MQEKNNLKNLPKLIKFMVVHSTKMEVLFMVLINLKNTDISRPLRVACFYRVSSKGQLNNEDDIPSQRRSCTNFYKEKGWVFVKEYVEQVSGYRVFASDRDKIQEAKRDAEAGMYDVLLCWMFDRLGRKEAETPFVVEWFAKRVQVWSVVEGQQKFEQHTDHLMNYIRFWQAEGESKKTSIRVTENLEQMAEDGLLTGGSAGYGYKLVKSGVFNKKGKELFRRVKDEETNKIAYLIYDLVYSQGFGSNRIAKHLNDRGVHSATGGKWSSGAINFILRNPLYKGCPAFGKRRSEEGKMKNTDRDAWVKPKDGPIPELITVPEEMWDRVQQIRTSKNPENTNNLEIEKVLVTKSPLLFVGMIRCGYCNSPLTTTYNSKKYTLKDGTEQKWRQAKYRCSGKALSKTDCQGQTTYAKGRIEDTVLDEVFDFLDRLKQIDLAAQLQKIKKDVSTEEETALKKLNKHLKQLMEELNALTGEVAKSISGKSSFKPDLLNKLIEQKEEEIQDVMGQIEKLSQTIKSKKIEKAEMEGLVKSIPVWKEVFQAAPPEKQKMMLNDVVDRITVYRDHIDVKIKVRVQQLIGSVNGSETDSRGRASELIVQPKIIEAVLKLKLKAG